jgi:hypothetical protein
MHNLAELYHVVGNEDDAHALRQVIMRTVEEAAPDGGAAPVPVG